MGKDSKAAVQGCPGATGTIWVGVKRGGPGGGGQAVAGASVTLDGPTPGSGATDGSGYAKFPGRTPGSYTFAVTLPGKPHYVLEDYSPNISVSGGEVAIGRATAYPTGTLVVRVLDDLGNRVEADAVIDATSSGTLTEPNKGGDLYKKVAAGKTRVNATANRSDLYAHAAADVEVDVPEGGTVRADIVLPVLNTVMPQLAFEKAEGWCLVPDPPPSGPAPVPAPPAPVRAGHKEPPVPLRLGYLETRKEKPYTGNGTFSYDAAKAEVYRTDACTGTPVGSGTTFTNAELKKGVTLYVKPKAPGSVDARLALDPSSNKSIQVGPPVDKSLPVREINVVEPRVRVEHKVVLLDRKISRYQKDEDKKAASKKDADAVRFVPKPTFIELSATKRVADPAYAKSGKLVVAPANVELFTDEDCKKKFDPAKPIPFDKLAGNEPMKLYLQGKTKGKFSARLELEPSGDPHVIVEHPSEVKMGVVEVEMILYHHDLNAIAKLKVDPDDANYLANLEALKLPDQKAMTDEEKVKAGRMLHLQSGTTKFGRAKLVVKKLDASQWPDGVDDYRVVLDQNSTDGELKVFDAEVDGNEVPLPKEIKVSDLKLAGEPAPAICTFWVEGSKRTSDKSKTLGARLDLGVDRVGPTAGGAGADEHVPLADKAAKRNGDGARFTIVEIEKIEVEYKPEKGKAVAWDATKNRFYVNLKKDPAGRPLKVRATLAPAIKDVTVHLMLAPDVGNQKQANWGVAMPATWKWHEVTRDIKHKDRDPKDSFLSYSAQTDDKGRAEKHLVLSRVGGDKFWLAAHLAQDPELAKYVDGHATLGKRVPKRSEKPVEVWRKFWYQELKVTGVNVHGFDNAADAYEDVKVAMEAADVVEMSRKKADGLSPKVIYPKHMLSYYLDQGTNSYRNNFPGDASDGLAVGDALEGTFFALAKPAADKPVMIPMLNVNGLWVADGASGSKSFNWADSAVFAAAPTITMDKKMLDPPLQGGTLLASGTWRAQDWDPAANAGAGAWVNDRNGNLAAADIYLDPNRSSAFALRLRLPGAIVVAAAGTRVKIQNLSVRGAVSYLGTSYAKGIINCWTPNDPQDFVNTINHELGHSFGQTPRPGEQPSGIPDHPRQYIQDGSHCSHPHAPNPPQQNPPGVCLMFEFGPVNGSLNRYCPQCHPYVLVQEFWK